MTNAIEAEELGRIYRVRPKKMARGTAPGPTSRVALSGVNLQVRRGELFGLLGPNGAGKTTLIKILTTLLAPSSGRAQVAGHDVALEPHLVRPLINMVSGGEASGYGLLTVRENLWMFAQFYGMGSAEANRRIRELLDTLRMGDRLHTKCYELSTGLRQKMNIIRGFLTDPDVLFLDEPTLGLDVGASRDVRSFTKQWMSNHPTRTLLLTTHHMAEADELCDRVAIINDGRVLACDRPSVLKRRLQGDVIFHLETTRCDGAARAALHGVHGLRSATCRDTETGTSVELRLDEERALGGALGALQGHDVQLVTLTKREPTLEDVFVDLVGHSMAEVELAHEPVA